MWRWGVGEAVRRDVQEGGDICIHVTYSPHHTAETQQCKVAISQFFKKGKKKKNKPPDNVINTAKVTVYCENTGNGDS